MTTATRTEHEKNLLKEIEELPESELLKIIKMIHFLKTEIFQTEGSIAEDLDMFWKSFGSWQDERSPEETIKEIYESRKSANREIQL